MKQPVLPVLCRDSAKTVAKRLTKSLGSAKALSLAEKYSRQLKTTSIAEVNIEIFPERSLRRLEYFWTNVRNILTKDGTPDQKLNKFSER